MAIIAGLLILLGPATAYKLIFAAGQIVWLGILVGALVSIMGLFVWFSPSQRHFFGILIVLASLVSFITSDLGGLLLGMLLGIIGGALAFAWTPLPATAVEQPPTYRERPVLSGAADGSAAQVEEPAEVGAPTAEP